jgi:arylsulfatase A-like enzyme
MGKLIFGAVVGALAGAAGGALLGLGESVLVTWTSAAAEEYWLFLFGVLSYGAIGALFGAGAAAAWQVVRTGRAGNFEISQLAAGLGFLFPALFVTRYHVSKRLFNEQLGFGTASGIIAHVLIVLGVLVAALLIVGLVRIIYRRVGIAGPAVAFAAMVGVGTLVGLVAGGGAADTPVRSATGDRTRPNVILVVADTLRADSARDQSAKEPDGGLARLRRDGVAFEAAYAQSSWTRPSVASILTGQYPSSHGTVHKMDFMASRIVTLAEVLRDAGYWTAGVTTNINVAPIFNLHQGFSEFTYLEPSFYFGATDSAAKLVIYKSLRTLRERFFANRVHYEHFYQDAQVVNDHVTNWLGQKPPEPFFLFIHYMDPHDPYFEIPYNGSGVARVTNPSPAAERAGELRSLYLQGVQYLDGRLRELFEGLRAAGVYDESYLAFVADHGEEFFEHDGWWHGTTLYDEQLHVPLMIKLPGNAQAGSSRADRVRSIDIAPSVLGALEMRAPGEFQGVDLMRQTVDEPLIAEEDLEGNRIFSIRDGDWKLIVANAGNPRGLASTELYDVAGDPGESNNVAAAHPQKVAELEARLRSMLPAGTL